MNHTIDTKAILELAETSPEARAYLEREFPEAFAEPKRCPYDIPAFIIPPHKKHDVLTGAWMISNENDILVMFIKYTDDDCFLAETFISGQWETHRLLGYQFRPATTEEIQKFILDYKPNN